MWASSSTIKTRRGLFMGRLPGRIASLSPIAGAGIFTFILSLREDFGIVGGQHWTPSNRVTRRVSMSTVTVPPPLARPADRTINPAWLRVTHWVNALAVVMMVASGWRIYNASPLFRFSFPDGVTLGGWLAGALQWHFAAMWLLVANGTLYLVLNVASGRLFHRFFPLSLRGVLSDACAALRGRLAHDDPCRYNQVQRAAYLFVMLDLVVLLLSGLVLWKSVQFGLLRELMGGYETARRVHFAAMALLVAFVGLHLAMVALVPRTLRHMVVGR
jgi:thiosulfate reductase cytochrome b subunit